MPPLPEQAAPPASTGALRVLPGLERATAFEPEALARHRELVARMGAGDAEALRLLVTELHGRVQGVVQRILRDPETACETVQDVFVKAWRGAGGYRPERGEVISWLVFMARNGAIDRVRRRARQRELLEELQDEGEVVVSPPAYLLFEQREEVARGLAELAPSQRRALELSFFEGCTQNEVASAMKIPVGNVKNHLRRGMLKLRELFSAHE
ncbi:MAG: sigma-70 family RNA polymerase sigma factor [Opitutaceae bacterium]|nr:sigma-70 family RNA polymerase sigma factor [Opitutaceae bacterium]